MTAGGTLFCWRVAGPPRAIRRVMVLIAAQRIMAHLQVGEATMLIEEAEARAYALADAADRRAAADEDRSVEDLVWAHGQGRVAQLCKDAADLVVSERRRRRACRVQQLGGASVSLRRRSEMGKLEGEVALITGAARGQGRGHAVPLVQEGASVIAVWDETIRQVKDLGRNRRRLFIDWSIS